MARSESDRIRLHDDIEFTFREAAELTGKNTLLGRAFLVEANRICQREEPYSLPLYEWANQIYLENYGKE